MGLNKDDNEALDNGVVTDELIDKWLVWLGRCEDSTKQVEHSQDFRKGKSKFKDLEWYSKETEGPRRSGRIGLRSGWVATCCQKEGAAFQDRKVNSSQDTECPTIGNECRRKIGNS